MSGAVACCSGASGYDGAGLSSGVMVPMRRAILSPNFSLEPGPAFAISPNGRDMAAGAVSLRADEAVGRGAPAGSDEACRVSADREVDTRTERFGADSMDGVVPAEGWPPRRISVAASPLPVTRPASRA